MTGTLMLAGVLLVLGLCAAGQVGSARRTLGRVEDRRMLDLVAEDAFEEACARIEAKPPTSRGSRPVTMRLQLVATVADAKADGVRVDLVRATTSPLMFTGQSIAMGVIELSVPVSREGEGLARVVTVRRQFQVAASGAKPKITISDRNVYREVRER